MEYLRSLELDFGILTGKTIEVKQLDRQSRYLEIVPLYLGDKTDIRSYSAKIFALRPDKTVLVNDCTINADGNVIAEIAEDMTAVDGTVRCDIKLYENDSVISSAVFYLKVIQSIMRSNIIYAWQCRAYSNTVRVKSNGEIYELAAGEELIFTLFDSDVILRKTLTVRDSESGGYLLSLSSEELNLPAGNYYYDIALRRLSGEPEKVIRKTAFKLQDSSGVI